MAKTFATNQLQIVGAIGDANNAQYMQPFPEVASSAWIAGELVFVNSSGLLKICPADPTVIAGQAPHAASGTTSAAALTNIMFAGQICKMNLMGSAGADVTCTQAMIGESYGIQSISGKWAIDQSDATNKRVRVLAFADGAIVGDINVPCLVVFAPSFLQFAGVTTDSPA